MRLYNKVITDKVWDLLMKEPQFQAQPEATFVVYRELVDTLPEILADMLDTPVSIVAVAEAKIRFLKRAVEINFITRYFASLPEDTSFGFFGKDVLVSNMESAFAGLVDMLSELKESLPSLLEESGMTEAEIMMMPTPQGMGLTPETYALYEAGDFTIGDLLVTQPAVITKNTE